MAIKWEYKKIEDIAEKVGMGPFGSSIKVETFVPDGIPIISGQHLHGFRLEEDEGFNFITEEHATKLRNANVFRGDVIFTHAGNIENLAYIPENSKYERYIVSQRQFFMRCDLNQVLPSWVVYYFNTHKGKHDLTANSSPVGVPSIAQPVSYLRQLKIPVPHLSIQRRITDILSALDDKIELNRQTNATLEKMSREMFTSWFIDFEPVYAKANGHTPLSLRPEIAKLFPDTFQKTELGDIPINWQVMTVEDVTERVAMGPFGSSIKVETFVDEGIPIISGQHLRGFMLTDSTYNYISFDHAEKLKKANVYRGDVIFTHAGNIENLAFIPEDSQYSRYVVSQRQFYVRCNLEKVTPTFITFYFQSPGGQHKLLANKSPVGVPSIAQPVTYLRSIKLPIPPKPILDEFERITSPLLQKYQANVHESQTLANLRDTLLPKLMSGEIEV